MDASDEIVDLIVNLVIRIGREGRGYEPVGTLFIVGDTKRVLQLSSGAGVDPFHGYGNEHRNLRELRVQEDAKEIAKLDGAFIVDSAGVIQRSRQMLEIRSDDVVISAGLGSRHWAAITTTRRSSAIAVVLSKATGTVRVYKGGNVVDRVDPTDE